MARDVPTLGELEIRVLRLVWEHQPCTERQISDLIQADREVARTTVLKTMQRLEGKLDEVMGRFQQISQRAPPPAGSATPAGPDPNQLYDQAAQDLTPLGGSLLWGSAGLSHGTHLAR